MPNHADQEQKQEQQRPTTPDAQKQSLKAAHVAPSPSPSIHSPLPKRVKSTPSGEPTTPSTSTSTSIIMSGTTANAAHTGAPALLIKLLRPSAQAPKRGSALAAGYDLFASEATSIPARGKALVSTGLAMALPAGTYGRVAPRSGLASKHHIDTGAGVIDADYRGEVKVLLFNHGGVDFGVERGDRVAQLIVERIYTPEIAVVEELEESVRGAGGFGSTGVNANEDGVGSGGTGPPPAIDEPATNTTTAESGHYSHGAGGAGGIA